MGELLQASCPSVDLDQEIGNLDPRQCGVDPSDEGPSRFRYLLAGLRTDGKALASDLDAVQISGRDDAVNFVEPVSQQGRAFLQVDVEIGVDRDRCFACITQLLERAGAEKVR